MRREASYSTAHRSAIANIVEPCLCHNPRIIAIHTTSDALVLGSDVTAYDDPAALAGTSERFVARFVEADGHCNFTPAQTGTAFDALLAWVREGKRPAAGEQK